MLELFCEDDGSLPDIELNNLSGKEVIDGYKILKDHSGSIVTENPCYWSVSQECIVPILIDDNPSSFVISGEAEPFHLCFGDIKSPTGKRIPVLGVFVYSDGIALDYRMGPEWNQDAIEGLFELMLSITESAENVEVEHKSNINDLDGSIFKSYWSSYQYI